MSAFDAARKFFDACESAEGWAGCQQYVADGATFDGQCEPLVDITTVEGYTEWARVLGTEICPGATYDIHNAAFDENTQTALFFATFHGKHTGDAGPVPATNQETHTHYVYTLTMNASDQVEHMVKIWNAPWAMKELGWA